MSRNDGGRLFHVAGPATEKVQSPNLVLVRTVVAALVRVGELQSASGGIGCGKLN